LALLVAGALVVLAVIAVTVSVLISPDRDLRCDESRKVELTEQGREYSCVLRIPEHPRPGH
jgi:hypothetical protein